MAERCTDCPRDATHTLRWHATAGAWRASKLKGPRDGQEGRYCAWHATVQGTQRNARGICRSRRSSRPASTEQGEA